MVLRLGLLALLGGLGFSAPAVAASKERAFLKALSGEWIVLGAKRNTTCRVILKNEATIGGSEIIVSPDCTRKFAVMGDITAWRVSERGELHFVDALRKMRVRFQTPDNSYVAIPEVDGIDRLEKATRR